MTTTTTNYDSIANSFYLAFYGRPADPVGLKFWSQQVANVNGDLTSIVNAFATSQEAQDRFGSDTTADRVTEIYQQLFNRDPEAEGLSFWQNAVEKGNASLADVALAILKGSQGTDGQLVELRQQAMDKFTAEVEASGSQYVGAASIEAARILVRAVTLNATSSDIDTLVKSAVSFADTATKTPAVVDAIAIGTTLNKLFDTARGTADPVALAQTLADTAKAAAGNPVTLDSLLRGGGMDKVLKVMPADATLTDVVKALASGGLPAAIEVVYPTKPSAPVTGLTLSFKTVSHDLNDAHPDDNVTNAKTANVSFNASKALASNQHVEYSVDGGNTWVKNGTGVTVSGNVITIKDVDLSHALSNEMHYAADVASGTSSSVHTMTAIDNHANVETTISLRVVDSSGNTAASTSQKIVYDGYVATPYVVLNTDSLDPHFAWNGQLTNVAAYDVKGIDEGVHVAYSQVEAGATLDKPTLHEGLNSFTIRQYDAAGNKSEREVNITLDTKAPEQTPVLATAESELSSESTSGATNTSGKFAISNLDTHTDTAWYYSIDNGSHWTFGGINNGSGTASLDVFDKGSDLTVLVRQQDAAGNIGTESNAIEFIKQEAAGPVTVTLHATAEGLDVASDKAGQIYLVSPLGGETRVYATGDSGGDAVAGHVTLGAQATGVSGNLLIKAADGGTGGDSHTMIGLGSNGAESLYGSYVWGFGGNDNLSGTSGDDKLFGGDGDDMLYGWGGADTLTGGNGADTYMVQVTNVSTQLSSNSGFNAAQSGSAAGGGDDHGDDTIVGFEFGTDTLWVSATGVTNFNHASAVYVGGAVANSYAGAVGAFANNVALVDLDSNGGFGEFAVNFDSPSAALSVANLKASIRYDLTGTDGNDTITTGVLADTINGGKGNDIIHAGDGADMVVGGAGADTLDIGLDSARDLLVFNVGDTATGVFADGGSTAGMDAVLNLGVQDTLRVYGTFTATSTPQTSYLQDAAAGHFAVVQGSDANGVFKAGDAGTDNDYLFQWSDGSQVNSILLHDFGTAAPTFSAAANSSFVDIQLTGVAPVETGIPG
nr:DUF4214 domain-containing protein [uncultured Massilia sp.]